MLISLRTLGEYRVMLALTEADLARRILDCLGGMASFTAEVNAAGETPSPGIRSIPSTPPTSWPHGR